MKSTLINMVAVLFSITLIASAGVGAVNMITVEPIAAAKAAAAAPDNAKLAEAAAKAQKVADDAAAGVAIPQTFKDYLDKWVYSVKDQQEMLNKIGGARLMSLRNAPHLGYSVTHLK